MWSFQNYSQSTHSQILVSAKVLEKLRKNLFAEFSLSNEQWRYVHCQTKPPFRKLQKVFTISFEISVQIAPKSFIFPEISFANVYHSFNTQLFLQPFYFQQRIVQKRYFLFRQVISIKLIAGQIHAHVHVSVFSFGIWLFSIKSNIFDSLTDGKSLCVVEKLRKNSLSSVRFGYKDRTNPPNFVILIGEKHGSNWLTFDLFN